MNLTMDPELFSIAQSKEIGVWPPGNIVAHGIFPYILRLKPSTITILDVGCMKGENAIYMLDKDEKKKIEKIYGVVSPTEGQEGYKPEYKDILKQNTKDNPRFTLNYKDQQVDVVCIHANSDLDASLRKYYNKVKHNGIFCGNEHGTIRVREALSKFRREVKIGTPINVSNDCWFWWVR